MQTLLRDLRYGAQMLLKNKMFSAVAVLSLALGIGANSAIFSLVSAVLWRQLPYPYAERLLIIGAGDTVPNFIEYTKQSQTLEQLSAFETQKLTLTGKGTPLELIGQRI